MGIATETIEIVVKNNKTKKPTQFTTTNDKDYFFANRTCDKLPSGFYTIKYSDSKGLFSKKSELFTDNILVLPNLPHKKILDDIEKFWECEEKFKEYELVYKRGFLLHGAPGCGKSSVVNLVLKDIIDRGGVAFEMQNPYNYSDYIKLFREVEPERPVVVVIEDIDDLIAEFSEKEITNILDGINQTYKVVYLATTNNMSKLGDKIKKRPSRFDRVIEIKKPQIEDRKVFLENKIKETDRNSLNIDKWVKDTEGLTISHLKELIISVIIMGNEYDETLELLKNMSNDSHRLGFGQH